ARRPPPSRRPALDARSPCRGDPSMFCRRLSLLLPAALLAAAGGCERKQAAPTDKNETPVVPVSKPLKRSVTDFVDFTGRTDAVEAVDIRARVNGYLVKLAFREGDIVRGDD